MKKLMIMASAGICLSVFAQTGTLDGTQSTQTGTTIPGQTEFSKPANLENGRSRILPGDLTENERDFQQQRMEDSSGLNGGSLGGSTNGLNKRTAPVGVGTGVDAGTGSGSGF
ncbi:MAG TPA: hypothetical protein VNJ01_07520 [Bacteriovoracaceae bacterium]|nr:hypothetical protein [Bacteriovoracaceae bacterium]